MSRTPTDHLRPQPLRDWREFDDRDAPHQDRIATELAGAFVQGEW